MKRATLAVLFLFLAGCLWGADETISKARRLYQRTDYQGAASLLEAAPDKSGAGYALLGQSYYMDGDAKRATEALEKAVTLDASSAEAYHWLGRAYGRRAETSSYFTAPRYASKARQAFERAVELDPKNMEAVNDLFEFYLQAPGFLGGGLDRAAKMAEKIRQLDPAEYHFAMAEIAMEKKEFQQAEQQLRRAAEIAPRQVGRILDLAKFVYKQGRSQEGEELFAKAEKVAPNDPKTMFARASAYVTAKQNLDTAKVLLKQYMKSPLTPDDPPREEAQKLLRMAGN